MERHVMLRDVAVHGGAVAAKVFNAVNTQAFGGLVVELAGQIDDFGCTGVLIDAVIPRAVNDEKATEGFIGVVIGGMHMFFPFRFC